MPSKHLSLFKFPGGKSKMIDVLYAHLQSMLLNGAPYNEGFLGGGPLLLYVALQHPTIDLYANDLDENVYEFWNLLANGSDDEFRSLCDLININPTIDIFWNERKKVEDEELGIKERDSLTKAYHCVFFHKTTFNGMFSASPIGGKEQKSKWKVDCHYTAKNIIKKITEARERVHKRLIISQKNILDYINDIPESHALYLDPPYYTVGHSLYPVYMKKEEHEELAKKLNARKNWVLSYDVCPEIASLYKFAKLNLTTTWYSSSSFAKTKKCKVKEEYIITPC